MKGTLADLGTCGARPAAIATLAVLGEDAEKLANAHGLPLETLASLPNRIWEPASCPLCERGVPLSNG